MSFSYKTNDLDDGKLSLKLFFDPNSIREYSFLDDGNFSEVILLDNRASVKMQKNSDIDEQLKKGIIINDKHYPLFRPSYPKPEITKPTEESSIKEIEERLIAQKVLEKSKVHKIKKPSPTKPIKVQQCPECESIELMRDYEASEIVCTNCGFVIAEKLADLGPEWRAFDADQRKKRTRVGAPLTFTVHDKGLSTMIDWRDRDIYGKRLKPGQKAQIYRLRKWQKRIRVSDATERNLAYALSDISKISNKLSLPKNILETASVIYRKANKKKLIRGRSIKGVTAAAVYIACRQAELPRTLDEVSQASNVNKKEVARSYRFIIKELDYYDSIKPIKPSQYVTKFSNQLIIQGKVEEIAHKILATAREKKLTSGRGPTGIAAAASYIASMLTGERKTQREIANIAQVTEVTIRNRYKELVERLQFNVYL